MPGWQVLSSAVSILGYCGKPGWRRSTYILHLERLGWIHHQQHGDPAQYQRKGRCLRVWDHAINPRHPQLLCAVGPTEENECRRRTDRQLVQKSAWRTCGVTERCLHSDLL